MNIPTMSSRIELTKRPAGQTPVMYQKWRDLLFLHWNVDVDEIQLSLPDGLTVDTYEGKAFLGIVPFFMRDIRPRFCPAIPGISNFLELNVRTYVIDETGRPGVWFYSLDANQWLAVRVARKFFHLPYHEAFLSAEIHTTVQYKAVRKGESEEMASFFEYAIGRAIEAVAPGSFEYFLIERYLLFARDRKSGRLFSGRVHHSPYPLREVVLHSCKAGIALQEGFSLSNSSPDHAVISPGVDVSVYAIEGIGSQTHGH